MHEMSQKNKDIAIVGMSCFAPGASDIHQYWNNLKNGVDSIIDAPEDIIDPRYFKYKEGAIDRFYSKRGGFAPEIKFDPVKYSMLPVSIPGMDTAHLLALKLVYEALEDASVFEKKIPLTNGCLIIGKGNYLGTALKRAVDIVHVGEQVSEIVKMAMPDLSSEDLEKIRKAYQQICGRYQADSMVGLIPNLIASLIANKLDMHGPAYTLDAACASSLLALDHAINEINSGNCDIAIAGGVHLEQNAVFWSIFNEIGALSKKQKITPFDETADGLLPSEGAGFVVVKDLEKAIADNDRIYCVIKGVGISSDGHATSPMAPAVEGQRLAIDRAWEKAGIDRTKIGYVEAHGTATVVGDKTELASLDQSFPSTEANNTILLGSVKSNIGHAMPAAGVLSLIKTVLSLYHRQIPPTLHCENPLKAMGKTRFRPAQKLEEWNEHKYPLVAGVNSFGFGGINAHVVLEAYKTSNSLPKIEQNTPFTDKVLVLSAKTKEALIENLKKGSIIREAGDYRLVLFNPTADRVDKAISLITKDKPWKGRMDIWYSNEPLLSKGGKIGFFYPGYDPSQAPEVDSIIDYFNISFPEIGSEENLILDNSLKLYRCSESIHRSLDILGVQADLNFGHSLGEWLAMVGSKMFGEDSVNRLLASLDPEQYRIDGVYFVAVSAGVDTIQKYLNKIDNLFLSNDNCPHQVLLCGTTAAIDELTPMLQEDNLFYQILPFQSGLHTPLIKHKLHLLEECFSHLKYEKMQPPLWSCNSLDVYPRSAAEIKELSIKHVLEPVRFRELIEKLYNEQNVRVFIQIGEGSMLSFIDDTLAGRKYSNISAAIKNRSTLEQLRRVLALLYIEGHNINLDFIGANIKDGSKVSERGIVLDRGMQIHKKLPLLSETSLQYWQRSSSSIDLASLSIDTDHPILKALSENIKEMALMQVDMVKLFQSKGKLKANSNIPTQETKSTPSPVIEKIEQKPVVVDNTGKVFEEDLYVSLDTHPLIIDHSLVVQPKHWNVLEDLTPVIPMTMTFELLAEAAHKQDLSKKILKLAPISVFQWMGVITPFVQKINGSWKSKDLISLNIKGFASGDVLLGDEYPKVDPVYESEIDLGENIRPLPSKELIYEMYMFHGPAYQGIDRVTHITDKGIRAYIKHSGGKGALLDNLGQVYGLYLQLTLEENSVTFPVKVQDISFYQDFEDQEGIFECVCVTKSIDADFATADIILKRDGKVWCVIKGWQNRRFEFDNAIWQMMVNTENSSLAEEIAPGIFYYHKIYNKTYTWDFLQKRYLNQPEKARIATYPLNKHKDYLISRIALKDALRKYVERHTGKKTYPIEYFLKYDEHHKPLVYGLDELAGVEVSLAHKGTDSVAIVSDKPVGIDIETIEQRSDEFMNLSFTANEIEMLKNRDLAEWSTKFWVAKEAYGKKLGLGLQGNPKKYEIKSIKNDDELIIEDCSVRVMKFKNFIVGWTE